MRVVACVLFALCGASPCWAQRVVELAPTNGTIEDDFTNITSVRELPDGRVLIADTREKRLVVADWKTGYTERLGRVGSGPGEFRSPRYLLALGPDSTLLFDTQQHRVIVIVGADKLRPFPVKDGLRVTSFSPPIRGVDRDSRLVVYAKIPNRTPDPDHPGFQTVWGSDSVLVVIANLWQPGLDTIARIRGKFRGRSSVDRTIRGRQWVFELVNPFGVEEQAWMFPDGWMALALASPYRVDWRTPDGTWIHGAPLPFTPIPATDTEKLAAMSRYAMAIPEPQLDPSEYPGWPEFVPPFTNAALVPLHDGRVAIARFVTSASTLQVYDIVDRNGALSARIQVPLNSRIIAFGRESVYLVTRGAYDVERLTRHPLPQL